MKFDHIGIFVSDVEYGKAHLKNYFKITNESKVYKDKNNLVIVQFLYDSSGICYELVSPLGTKSPVTGVLNNKKNILNHVAYKSNDFEKTVDHFRDIGCIPLGSPKRAVAFNNARIIFFLTKIGFIIEIIEVL